MMTETERMQLVLQKLKETSFFKMPASTKYHSNHEGGLFEHCTSVWLRLRQLTDQMNLKWDHPSSPFVVAMLHDACKIDAYFYNYDYKCWERNPDHPEGHGDLSLKVIDQLGIELTDQEKACIRWHMGAFDEVYNWGGFTATIKDCPNALWTHVADLVSTHADEKTGGCADEE